MRSRLGLLRLFGAIELFEQIEQLIGNAFVLNRPIECTQPRADIRIRTQPIVCLPSLRPHTLLGHQFILYHTVSLPSEFVRPLVLLNVRLPKKFHKRGTFASTSR